VHHTTLWTQHGCFSTSSKFVPRGLCQCGTQSSSTFAPIEAKPGGRREQRRPRPSQHETDKNWKAMGRAQSQVNASQFSWGITTSQRRLVPHVCGPSYVNTKLQLDVYGKGVPQWCSAQMHAHTQSQQLRRQARKIACNGGPKWASSTASAPKNNRNQPTLSNIGHGTDLQRQVCANWQLFQAAVWWRSCTQLPRRRTSQMQ
jgi:hypothetical protein